MRAAFYRPAWRARRAFVHIYRWMNRYIPSLPLSASHPLEQKPRASPGRELPTHRRSSHTSRFRSCLLPSRSSLPAVCLKVRASSQLQQLNIKLAAAASPRAQLTQSIALHYSWGRMRWPLTEGWVSTVPNFMGAGGRVTPSTTAYRQRK